MEALNEFFINYGYLGMGLAAFLAGTFVPFSSEAVLCVLIATTGMDPLMTVLSATAGNVAGSMFNYFLGRLGSPETISRWFHIKPRRMERAERWVERYGSWMGLLTFLPILGTAIAIALGMMRANVFLVFLATLIGKFIRYVVYAYFMMALI